MTQPTGRHEDDLPSAAEMHVTDVVHLASVTSTMDEAHARAASGAPAGTLVVADEQVAGRGRGGNNWESDFGDGVWCTLLERPTDASAIDVLSIRLGLAVAEALEPLSAALISVKWPNDLYVGPSKLAGILVEARWREGVPEWVAIGVGVNLRVPHRNSGAAALLDGTTRGDVLRRMIPTIRAAAEKCGLLSVDEQTAWMKRDLAMQRAVRAPVAGVVRGLDRDGALLVTDAGGRIHQIRSGSLVFAAD